MADVEIKQTREATPVERDKRQEMPRPRVSAAFIAILSAIVLLVLIFFGSRGLRDFDAALIGYAVGTVFAVAALAYRYILWIGRPPTWRYFRAGWVNFLSWSNFRHYTFLIPRAWWTDIFAQTFILRRGLLRWIMHMSIFWGVILSLLITLPLTLGWLHFTLIPPNLYRLWFFGIPLFIFPIRAGIGFAIFHGLAFSAARVPESLVPTHCAFCGVQCGMYLKVADGKVIGVEARDFPHNRGSLCPKGVVAYQQVNHPDRLHYPMIRRGGKGGKLERASWDEALDYIVSRWKRLQDEYGKNAIAVYSGSSMTNEKCYVMGKFARVGLGTRHVDYNGRLCMSSAAVAYARAFGIDRAPLPMTRSRDRYPPDGHPTLAFDDCP
jgi:hypothetical protein